jgi:hypothetical protein
VVGSVMREDGLEEKKDGWFDVIKVEGPGTFFDVTYNSHHVLSIVVAHRFAQSTPYVRSSRCARASEVGS